MMLVELQLKLNGAGISDILLPGFLDQDENPARFRTLSQAVYFECNSLYLRMAAIATTGSMRISIENRIEIPDQIDEDMTAAVTSLREQCLDDADGRNDLSLIRFWDIVDDANGLRCAAAQLDLVNGQQIFVDPTYHFGIRIGGSLQRESWRENWPTAKQALERVVTLTDGR